MVMYTGERDVSPPELEAVGYRLCSELSESAVALSI